MEGRREGGREVVAENLKGLHLPWPTCHDGVEQQPELVSVGWRRGDGKMSPNGDGKRGGNCAGRRVGTVHRVVLVHMCVSARKKIADDQMQRAANERVAAPLSSSFLPHKYMRALGCGSNPSTCEIAHHFLQERP